MGRSGAATKTVTATATEAIGTAETIATETEIGIAAETGIGTGTGIGIATAAAAATATAAMATEAREIETTAGAIEMEETGGAEKGGTEMTALPSLTHQNGEKADGTAKGRLANAIISFCATNFLLHNRICSCSRTDAGTSTNLRGFTLNLVNAS